MQDVQHSWDAGSNLATRFDVSANETETFTYDFLDRLTSVSGPYTDNWTYNSIGNIVSHNGTAYTYGSRPHAVTQIADNRTFSYDANGNMAVRGTLTGGSQNITWDTENRPVTITSANGTATFVYDGDGNRVKKIENGVTVLYINKYYEVNLTGGNATSYYYLGDRLVAMNSTGLRYIHQDHLSGTALVTSDNGTLIGSTKYYPYGDRRNSQGDLGTDKLFTGQRLDDTGLYYYNARYYDPTIGRFISADSTVSRPFNPQTLNRYSYVLNNPLKYIDPTGHQDEWADDSWYESLCETYGVDPGDGIAFVFGPEGFEGTLDTDTFVSWVDESPEPFDYVSTRDLPGFVTEALQHLGISGAFYYHMDLTALPLPFYTVGDEGLASALLGNRGGISLGSLGAFIRESWLTRDPGAPAHEGKHNSEQRQWGLVLWGIAYYGETLIDWAYYGGNYWTGPYNVNSREVSAREWAGDPPHPDPIPTPWWQPIWDDLRTNISELLH